MPYADEVYALRVFVPQESIYVGFEGAAYETLLSGCKVHDEQAVEVCLVAVAFHALPGYVLAVGRILGIGIVPFVLFGDVFRFPGGKVIDVNIGIGGDGIGQSRLFAAGIGHFVRSRVPGQLLDTAPGLHRAFVGFAVQNILYVADAVAVEVCNEGMRSGCHPFVPMLVHQVGNDDTGCLGQVGMLVGGALHGFYLRNEKQLLAVGRESESFDVSLVPGELFAFRTVRVHLPHLAAAAFVAEESDFLAVFNPDGLAFLPAVAGDLSVAAAIGIHDKQLVVALVFRYAVIGYRVSNLFLVGRYGYAADTAHCPKRFGRHALTFNLYIRSFDKRSVLSCVSGSAAGCQHHCCRHK